MFNKKNFSKKLTPVMDLDYDLSCAFHTHETLEKKIKMLAEHGFERLHIVAPPPGNPDYSHAARELPIDGPPNFLRQSRGALGNNPLKLAVEFAKCAGLEVIIVFKPYEGGGAFTIPHGMKPHCDRNHMETLGGQTVGLDPFIIKHPEFLIERKPLDELKTEPVTKIELVFVLDKIDNADKIKLAKFDDNAINSFPINNLQIYTSTNNWSYNRYESSFDIEERIELREVKDTNGQCVFSEQVRCRIIEISGLKIDLPYFAVGFTGKEQAFRTIPFSMCTVFGGNIKLPVTVSPTIRHNGLGQQLPFTEIGFEFEELGPYYWDCGWRACTLFGFARGKMKHLRGALCEAYPEVREYWLEQIQGFIDMGVDGVEIRLQSHCSGITDFVNYGFNPPLVDAYLKKYKVNILAEPADPIKLMELRGMFYESFIHAAKILLCKYKLKLLIHVHGYMEKPSLNPTFHELGFWANPKILPNWCNLVNLADEVIVKDYNFGVYRPEVANGIKNLAEATGTPLWIHCYLQQGHDWNSSFIESVENDSRITGILLYEVVWNDRENDGIVKVDGDEVTWVFNR